MTTQKSGLTLKQQAAIAARKAFNLAKKAKAKAKAIASKKPVKKATKTPKTTYTTPTMHLPMKDVQITTQSKKVYDRANKLYNELIEATTERNKLENQLKYKRSINQKVLKREDKKLEVLRRRVRSKSTTLHNMFTHINKTTSTDINYLNGSGSVSVSVKINQGSLHSPILENTEAVVKIKMLTDFVTDSNRQVEGGDYTTLTLYANMNSTVKEIIEIELDDLTFGEDYEVDNIIFKTTTRH